MKFKVGDVCITQHSRYPEVNDDQWVVIVHIDPSFKRKDGVVSPYVIERLDGLPHGSVTSQGTGRIMWFSCKSANCPEYMLRKPGDGDVAQEVCIRHGQPRPEPAPKPMEIEEEELA